MSYFICGGTMSLKRVPQIAIVVMTLLTACTALPFRTVSCEQILEEPLLGLDFMLLDRDTFPNWVTTTFEVAEGDLRVDEYDFPDSGFTESIVWKAGGRTYHADFVFQELKRIEVLWNSSSPRGRDVIRCLGEPEWYVARYLLLVRPSLDFQLWYPQHGIVVRSFTGHRDPVPPPLTKNQKMSYMFVVQPASLEEMSTDAFIGNSREIQEEIFASLKAWPGEWEAVEIEVGPVLQEAN